MVKLTRKSQKRRKLKERAKEDRREEEKRKVRIRNAILGLRGRRFEEVFVCDHCRHTHTAGRRYTDGEDTYEICEFCYNEIHRVPRPTTILYTPMGNKR